MNWAKDRLAHSVPWISIITVLFGKNQKNKTNKKEQNWNHNCENWILLFPQSKTASSRSPISHLPSPKWKISMKNPKPVPLSIKSTAKVFSPDLCRDGGKYQCKIWNHIPLPTITAFSLASQKWKLWKSLACGGKFQALHFFWDVSREILKTENIFVSNFCNFKNLSERISQLI